MILVHNVKRHKIPNKEAQHLLKGAQTQFKRLKKNSLQKAFLSWHGR